jgi:hypothetical protein
MHAMRIALEIPQSQNKENTRLPVGYSPFAALFKSVFTKMIYGIWNHPEQTVAMVDIHKRIGKISLINGRSGEIGRRATFRA